MLQKYCSKCPKNVHCCKFHSGGFVFIGIEDAKKIKSKTKLQYNRFLEYRKLPKSLISKLRNEDPSLEGNLRYSQLKDGKLLILKQKKKECIFLKDGRCTIYDVRPKICRIYPYWAMKLINCKIKVIEHDINPKCAIITDGIKADEEGTTSIFASILEEDKDYRKNISRFTIKTHLNQK